MKYVEPKTTKDTKLVPLLRETGTNPVSWELSFVFQQFPIHLATKECSSAVSNLVL